MSLNNPKNKWAGVGAAILLVALNASPAKATDRVEVDYMLNCQGCHLPDGRGFPKRSVPALTDHMGKFLWVDGGREFLVQVPGAATSDLADDRLAEVLNWMLVKFSPAEIPDGFVPYTSDEVGDLRKQPLIDVSDVRAQLIEKIDALVSPKEPDGPLQERAQ